MALTICPNCGQETANARCENCGAVVSAPAVPAITGVQPGSTSTLAQQSTQIRFDKGPSRRVPPKPKPPSPQMRKERYLARIRDESAYPTFRTLNEIVAGLLILSGLVLFGIAVLVTSQGNGISGGLVIAVMGLVSIIFGIVSKEVASIAADIADAVLDANSRENDTSSRH